jgi:hypothetical protein
MTFSKRHFGDGQRDCHDRLLFGHTGLWRFAEKAVGAACWNVRFRKFRGGTFDTLRTVAIPDSGHPFNVQIEGACLFCASRSNAELGNYYSYPIVPSARRP